MFFITRNEIISVVAFFAVIMIVKMTGMTNESKAVLFITPIALSVILSKLRSNRVNIPVKGKGKKSVKQEANFLNDVFVNNKTLSYGAAILWLSTLFIIVTELVKLFK